MAAAATAGAVDDLPGLDQPTAESLGSPFRSASRPVVRFLPRPHARGPSSASNGRSPRLGRGFLEVGPLSVGAMSRRLADRLGLRCPLRARQVLRPPPWQSALRVEVGRTLAERGVPALGQDLPVPDTVEELLERAGHGGGPGPQASAGLALAGALD